MPDPAHLPVAPLPLAHVGELDPEDTAVYPEGFEGEGPIAREAVAEVVR